MGDRYSVMAFIYGLMAEAAAAGGAWRYRLFDHADEVRLARELIEHEGGFEIQETHAKYPLTVTIRRRSAARMVNGMTNDE